MIKLFGFHMKRQSSRSTEDIALIFLMVTYHFFFYLMYLTLPMYLFESTFIIFIIVSYICHGATLEIEVVQWLQRLLCSEFEELLILLTLSLATYGSHLYTFKISFLFLKKLAWIKSKEYYFSGLWISDFFATQTRTIKSLVQNRLPKCFWILRKTAAFFGSYISVTCEMLIFITYYSTDMNVVLVRCSAFT